MKQKQLKRINKIAWIAFLVMLMILSYLWHLYKNATDVYGYHVGDPECVISVTPTVTNSPTVAVSATISPTPTATEALKQNKEMVLPLGAPSTGHGSL